MQTGRRVQVPVGSGLPAGDPNLNLFSATLTQNAGLNGRIRLPEAIAAGRTAACILQGIQITSVDQNDWEFWVWANAQCQSGHPDLEAFRGFWSFTVAGGDGKRIAGTGLYYYYIDGLGIFYEDLDAMTVQGQSGLAVSNGQTGAYLNVTLVNRSAGAKTANGWFHAEFVLEPVQGQ